MNFASVLKLMIPMLEPVLLQSWEAQGLPAVIAMGAALQAGKGKEEYAALCAFIDALAKIELARSI
jgi:hypothetical protein